MGQVSEKGQAWETSAHLLEEQEVMGSGEAH
jgi:hypothetical protein